MAASPRMVPGKPRFRRPLSVAFLIPSTRVCSRTSNRRRLAQLVNLSASSLSQPAVMSQRIPIYFCPSDPNDNQSAGTRPTYPTTYAAANGEWLVENVDTGEFGNGAFPGVSYPNQNGLQLCDITDGLTSTVGFAEVKALTPLLNRPAELAPAALPNTPAEILAFGGTFSPSGAYASWAVAGEFYNGLSFVFPPNTAVPYVNPADGLTYDVQWGSGTNACYSASTTRSYHPGGVNTLFMDGSVRFITNSISQTTWRALGTRNGGEAVVVPD